MDSGTCATVDDNGLADDLFTFEQKLLFPIKKTVAITTAHAVVGP